MVSFHVYEFSDVSDSLGYNFLGEPQRFSRKNRGNWMVEKSFELGGSSGGFPGSVKLVGSEFVHQTPTSGTFP